MNAKQINAIKTFYEKEQQALFNYALSWTGNASAAEDLIQQTFLKLMSNGGPPRDLRPYVFRALRNASIDLGRKHKRQTELLFDLAEAESTGNGCSWDDSLAQALDRLDADEREVIVLKTLEGFTFREIAAIAETPLATVNSRYQRGLKKMRQFLEHEK